MALCFDFHNCANCGKPTLCETYKDTCPWRLAGNAGIDARIIRFGCVCLKCMTSVQLGVQDWDGTVLEDDEQC